MQTPLFVRPLTADERATLETGLRSPSAFTVRRCQILLASADRWPLALAAEVRCAEGLTPRLVSDEAMRVALRRLGVAWKRAKHGMTSPDPAYLRKKNGVTT
jgi:hypothetical protein